MNTNHTHPFPSIMQAQIAENKLLLTCPCCHSTWINSLESKVIYEDPFHKIWGESEPSGHYFMFHCRECASDLELKILHRSPFQEVEVVFKKIEHLVQQKRKPIKPSVRYQVLKRDNYTCQSCGATVQDGEKLEVDHITPVSKGGTNDIENLQVLCKTCNIGKSDKH